MPPNTHGWNESDSLADSGPIIFLPLWQWTGWRGFHDAASGWMGRPWQRGLEQGAARGRAGEGRRRGAAEKGADGGHDVGFPPAAADHVGRAISRRASSARSACGGKRGTVAGPPRRLRARVRGRSGPVGEGKGIALRSGRGTPGSRTGEARDIQPLQIEGEGRGHFRSRPQSLHDGIRPADGRLSRAVIGHRRCAVPGTGSCRSRRAGDRDAGGSGIGEAVLPRPSLRRQEGGSPTLFRSPANPVRSRDRSCSGRFRDPGASGLCRCGGHPGTSVLRWGRELTLSRELGIDSRKAGNERLALKPSGPFQQEYSWEHEKTPKDDASVLSPRPLGEERASFRRSTEATSLGYKVSSSMASPTIVADMDH